MVTQNEVKIEPPQTANYLDSVAALADSSLNVFRRLGERCGENLMSFLRLRQM